ncbi:Disease resistance protein rga2 [Thalictrum thalictroides]|uniref:Disease resistance protein rga2 n=1 Tax=Thalictrum thalictroides TaxID=46969 RepID=A0A7J6WB14_THATH|nr:Disease resistance protein rga2 [Thalictrum thalictroides]
MAEALVSFLLEQLGSIVIGELVQEVKLIKGVEKEVESLTATLRMIQVVLKDADEKQVKDEAVKLWLEQLKDVSYDADDVLEEWFTRTLLSKLQKPEVNAPIKQNVSSILFSLVCCFKPVVERHEVGAKIRDLNERLDGIAEKKDRYKFTETRSEKESRPITSSVVDVSDIIGRNDDKEILVSKLLGESSYRDSKVPVISIVGTAGFGKTTLAKLILKEERVISYFEKQLWVCVSDPFDHQKVVKQIVEAATGKVIDAVSWEALLKLLLESVKGKRFILVLDDVWTYNVEDWYQLKTSLDGGAVGSRIIITTRDEKIAKLMHSTYIHLLKQLSSDDSFKMFQHIAFWGREDDLEFLQDVAKDIAHKCKGVPISIKVLATAMQLKKNIQDWQSVQASNTWNVQEGGVGFLPSILFSYYALPAELKSCLVYCAILPKDSKIIKKEIVELWMAQGYLGNDGSKDLESEGGHYFEDLAMRSFFQDFEKDSKGNIIGCKMHDLVHDFVQFLSKSETCILNEAEELKNANVRHLSTFTFDLPSICKLKKLRTLRHVLDYWETLKITDLGLLHQLTCLRVLDLSGSDLQELPSDVGMLLHLRYLNLSHTKLRELPENICNLLNLQTLKLELCSILATLPKGIGKLCNLRHLVIEGTESLIYLPHGLGRLSCLRTLSKFIIGDGNEIEGEGCNIRELGILDHLQGELRISNLGQVGNANEATEAKLKKKINLQSLILSFQYDREQNDDDERILEGLVPHTNLEELNVFGYKGTKLPDWILSLSNLVKLRLDYLFYLQLPALGKLHFLEVLELKCLRSVERIGEEFYGLSSYGGGDVGERDSVEQQQRQQIIFPRLKKLEFSNLYNWKEWDLPYPNGNKIEFFPNLVELNIFHCFPLQALPLGLGMLKSLESLKLNWMKEWEGETIPELKMDSMSTTSITIMPCLRKLEIEACPKLKVIPFYIFSHGLKISYYPNLNYFQISWYSQSSLPEGFNQLTSIRQLVFRDCKNLHFGPDDLKHLTMLEKLEIGDCPILAERFRGGGEISSSSSHIYNISIKSDNVHTSIQCDNCEMSPIVGKRYQCKDCDKTFDLCEECYNTPSKHTHLVNQHHRKGHTFELIANRGDSPVPVHPNDPSKDAEGCLVVAKSAEIEEQNKS